MGTTKSRAAKTKWLTDTLDAFFKSKPKGFVSRDKLCAQFAMSNNSTMRTGKELLDILALGNFIKIDKDVITR